VDELNQFIQNNRDPVNLTRIMVLRDKNTAIGEIHNRFCVLWLYQQVDASRRSNRVFAVYGCGIKAQLGYLDARQRKLY